MAKILSGKEVTAVLNEQLKERAKVLREKGITPKLAIVRCGENAPDISYEKGAVKRAAMMGVETELISFPETVSKETLMAELQSLNKNPSVHGVLLFRPLPRPLRTWDREICNVLDPEKDVDSMTDMSSAGVYEGRQLGFPPCTPRAVIKMLEFYGIELQGKKAVVIGRSLVVGKPVALMLMDRNATITICHRKTQNVPEITRQADLIVTTAGEANLLTSEYVSEGQTIIDVSVNWDPSKNEGKGGITGDARFEEVEPLVGAITPVPGGVGAVTTSILLEHVIQAAELIARKEDVVAAGRYYGDEL